MHRIRLTALVLAFLAPPSPGQETAPPSPPAAPAEVAASEFFESIDVNVVNVDVYVTDKKGNRVRGLTVDDF